MSPTNEGRVFVVDHQPSLLRAVTLMLHDVSGVATAAAVTLPSIAIELADEIGCDVILYGFPAKSEHVFDAIKIRRVKLPGAFIIASSRWGCTIAVRRRWRLAPVNTWRSSGWLKNWKNGMMIDSAYDGQIFNIALADVPKRKSDFSAARTNSMRRTERRPWRSR